MQSKFTILLLSACIFLFAQVQAACVCDANDTACLQNCVIQGQGCITACNGDNACYDNCIANFWPGQTVASASVAPVPSATSAVAPTSVVAPSVPASASAPVVVASSSAPVVASPAPVVSASRPAVSNSATFSPTAPTSATPPEPTSNGASSSFLVPAVAIGVASVTVITQVFFLARMGSVLFN
ncbi:hypothetical protein MFLAVUS_008997 [Mucor flavus]|uniref:Uncharacterized protein n=1 Tax=Mucor flavus TaxID=439312 RepID=A0ABP9Z8N6_9FUNG